MFLLYLRGFSVFFSFKSTETIGFKTILSLLLFILFFLDNYLLLLFFYLLAGVFRSFLFTKLSLPVAFSASYVVSKCMYVCAYIYIPYIHRALLAIAKLLANPGNL